MLTTSKTKEQIITILIETEENLADDKDFFKQYAPESKLASSYLKKWVTVRGILRDCGICVSDLPRYRK